MGRVGSLFAPFEVVYEADRVYLVALSELKVTISKGNSGNSKSNFAWWSFYESTTFVDGGIKNGRLSESHLTTAH